MYTFIYTRYDLASGNHSMQMSKFVFTEISITKFRRINTQGEHPQILAHSDPPRC